LCNEGETLMASATKDQTPKHDRLLLIAAAAEQFVRVMDDVEETVTTRAQRRRDQQVAYDALVEAVRNEVAEPAFARSSERAAAQGEAVDATDS
jgi:hypothetical protein